MLEDLDDHDWGTIFGDDTWEDNGEPRSREENLIEVHEVLDLHSYTRESVEKILYIHHGQKDEEDWELLAEMKDGGVLWISAGCDYTGWDCRAGGTAVVGSPQKLFTEGPDAIPRDARMDLLKKQEVKNFLKDS